MSDYYILRGHVPVLCTDLLTWARWLENTNRIVSQDRIGDVFISTVFLGVDHNFYGGDPLLFETMVFDEGDKVELFNGIKTPDSIDEYTQRYSTWDQAEEGHKQIMQLIRKSTFKVIQGGNHD
jgi:hypothetical protein